MKKYLSMLSNFFELIFIFFITITVVVVIAFILSYLSYSYYGYANYNQQCSYPSTIFPFLSTYFFEVVRPIIMSLIFFIVSFFSIYLYKKSRISFDLLSAIIFFSILSEIFIFIEYIITSKDFYFQTFSFFFISLIYKAKRKFFYYFGIVSLFFMAFIIFRGLYIFPINPSTFSTGDIPAVCSLPNQNK